MTRNPTGSTSTGATLAHLRSRAGLSLRQLSDKAGIPVATIHAIETGRTRDPTIGTLSALARVLGVSLDLLAGVHARPQRRAS